MVYAPTLFVGYRKADSWRRRFTLAQNRFSSFKWIDADCMGFVLRPADGRLEFLDLGAPVRVLWNPIPKLLWLVLCSSDYYAGGKSSTAKNMASGYDLWDCLLFAGIRASCLLGAIWPCILWNAWHGWHD